MRPTIPQNVDAPSLAAREAVLRFGHSAEYNLFAEEIGDRLIDSLRFMFESNMYPQDTRLAVAALMFAMVKIDTRNKIRTGR